VTGNVGAANTLQILRGGVSREVAALNSDLLAMMRVLGATSDDLDTAAWQLAGHDRRLLSSIYDAVRETESFHQLIFAPVVLKQVRSVLGDTPLHSPFQHSVFRMDLPSEPFRSFDWHQDYPYNMLSRDSVTIWVPLTGAGAFNGSIDVVRSDEARLYPFDIRWKRSPDGTRIGGRDAFITSSFADAFESCCDKMEMQAGDFAMFGSHVVHRSGRNPGPHIRFSVQVRFGQLLDDEVGARRWANRRSDGFDTFRLLHSDLIASEEQP
jgi:hypothetical protein